jgi:hypothetical protein
MINPSPNGVPWVGIFETNSEKCNWAKTLINTDFEGASVYNV